MNVKKGVGFLTNVNKRFLFTCYAINRILKFQFFLWIKLKESYSSSMAARGTLGKSFIGMLFMNPFFNIWVGEAYLFCFILKDVTH